MIRRSSKRTTGPFQFKKQLGPKGKRWKLTDEQLEEVHRRAEASVYNPTPEEIARVCAKIREGWDTGETERRTPEPYRNKQVEIYGTNYVPSPKVARMTDDLSGTGF